MTDLILKNRIDLQVASTIWVQQQEREFKKATMGHSSSILPFKERLRRRLAKRGFHFSSEAALDYTIKEFSVLSGVPLEKLMG